MTLNKAIKFNAKKCLKNNWGRAILIFVIMAAVSAVLGALDNAIFSAFGFHRVEISIDLLRGGYMEWWLAEGADVTWYEVALSILLSLVRLCIMAPLTLGAANWALELSDGRSNSIGELFWAFDNAAWYRSVWMSITVAVKTGLFAIAVDDFVGALGLTVIGTVGEETPYDSARHDCPALLAPGTPVIVATVGYAKGEQIWVKARVKEVI